MSSYGFSGSILHVDLDTHETRREPLDKEAAARFLGGFGYCIQLAAEANAAALDPFSPEAPVVLGVGPLVGTDAPSTSRLFGVGKMPASGTVGWCGAGGVRFSSMLKYAGVDHVVITGRSKKPVFLEITDRGDFVRDASQLWGQGMHRSTAMMKAHLPKDAGVVAIGPAGENRSAFSMAFVDGIGTLGRGGFGALLGAKQLKGIVAYGRGEIAVANRKQYRKLSRELLERMHTWKYRGIWQDLGMLQSFPVVEPDRYRELKKRRVACSSCPIGCKDEVEIPDGPHRGLVVRSSSAINLFTPVIYGIQDDRESIRLVGVLDDLGMDMFEFFGIMQCAARLAEKGVLAIDEPIETSDPATMVRWAGRIARREGVGDILADGFPGIFARFGENGRLAAPALVKGMHPYTGPGSALPWDRFGTMELGQILDPRGPHVGSGGSPTYFAQRPLAVFPKHLQRMGVPQEEIDRILAGPDGASGSGLDVGRLLRWSHTWFTILGSLGICARAQINRFYTADLCADLYEAVTGVETDAVSLRRRAERVWTLYWSLYRQCGIGADGETPPALWFKEPGFKEYLSGNFLQPEDVEAMIQAYYAAWGWDPQD